MNITRLNLPDPPREHLEAAHEWLRRHPDLNTLMLALQDQLHPCLWLALVICAYTRLDSYEADMQSRLVAFLHAVRQRDASELD